MRLLTTLFFIFIFRFALAQVNSNFNTGLDGWTAPNASGGGVINYVTTGGNPGGFISAQSYNIVGTAFIQVYFNYVAPAKFNGNFSSYYNGTLSFDLQQQNTASPTVARPDVTLSNGTITLSYLPTPSFYPAATPAWTSYSVTLNELSGYWQNSATGAIATQAEIKSVLSNITVLGIRGRFSGATLVTGLDNVLMQPPIVVTTQPVSPQTICDGTSATLSTAATGNSNITYHWQIFIGQTFVDLSDNARYSGTTTSTLTINTTGMAGANPPSTYAYICRISGTNTPDVYSNYATVNVVAGQAAPIATSAAGCNPSSITLTAAGGASGFYRWYTSSTGNTIIPGQQNPTYTTPTLTTTTTYYVSLTNGTCESSRTPVTATINNAPTPTTTGASSCSPAALTLSAAGGTTYNWYTVATGGTAIPGQTTNTYTTPVLSSTTTYYVSTVAGTCESTRQPVNATINTMPTAPTTSGAIGCSASSFILTATGGNNGQYRWYTAATGGTAITGEVNNTYTTPSLTTTTTYYVAINNGTCESARTSVLATVQTCASNLPPDIKPTTVQAPIEGKVTVSLTALISDPDNNLDLSTLKVIVQPLSGAKASIDGQRNLILDYTGITFSGTEKLTIQVCDLLNACTQKELSIEVVGDIIVHNGISPNSDGKNDLFFIEFIDALENTKKNHVSIYNRWGDLLFDVDNYDNKTHVFKGINNNGNEIPSGTYFYKIEFVSGKSPATGYLEVKK